MTTRTIPHKESMTVEFKSDRGRPSDSDLVLAVVCLANSDRRDIYLGVEDGRTAAGQARPRGAARDEWDP